MRIRREEWTELEPDDVAWVTEWQLASVFRWLPLGDECSVRPGQRPQPGDRHWPVEIRVGDHAVVVLLPLRDLAKLVRWCHSIREPRELLRVPANVRAAMLALRGALQSKLGGVDPLRRMGYATGEPTDA